MGIAGSLLGQTEMGRLLKDCIQLSIHKVPRQNLISILIVDKDIVYTAELKNI